jgi:hypothetical protein
MAEKITENLDTLKINVLSQEQYNKALAAGEVNEKELYFTPVEEDPGGGGGGTPIVGEFTDYNAVISPGFYKPSADADSILNGPTGYSKFKKGVLLVETMETGYIQQTTTHMSITATRYSTSGGSSWSNWEYINPPVMANTEYRTTERYLDKSVYTKLINCGAPYDGMSVKLYNSRISVIRHTGFMTRTGDYGLDAFPVPNGGGGLHFSFTPNTPDDAVVLFHCTDEVEIAEPAYTLYLQIWYTK